MNTPARIASAVAWFLFAVGCAALMGAAPGHGGITPGPTVVGVRPPLEKTGSTIGLKVCGPWETPLPNWNDAGYTCRPVVSSISGDENLLASVGPSSNYSLGLNPFFCDTPGDGFFWDQASNIIKCQQDPRWSEHIYTDAGIEANSVNAGSVTAGTTNTNALVVNSGSTITRFFVVKYQWRTSVTANTCSSVAVNTAVRWGSSCFASANNLVSSSNLSFTCRTQNNQLSISACCNSNSDCLQTQPDADFFGYWPELAITVIDPNSP